MDKQYDKALLDKLERLEKEEKEQAEIIKEESKVKTPEVQDLQTGIERLRKENSGTTGIACKNLNRNFIGIELDENYFEIAKNRILETNMED